MGRRAVSDSRAKSINNVAGSMLDEDWKISFPTGTATSTRRRMREVFAQNRHLRTDDQIQPVMRLCILRELVESLHKAIATEGVSVESPKGGTVPNPLIKSLTAASSTALSLERYLGIVFVSRNSQVKKTELDDARDINQPAKSAGAHSGSFGPPKLKIA